VPHGDAGQTGGDMRVWIEKGKERGSREAVRWASKSSLVAYLAAWSKHRPPEQFLPSEQEMCEKLGIRRTLARQAMAVTSS